jgi:hypothetical protein
MKTSLGQMQDGSFVSTYTDGASSYMVEHDASGNVKFIVPNFDPQIATLDGGLIAQTFDGLSTVQFDANGNAAGPMTGLLAQSWADDPLQFNFSSVDAILRLPVQTATSFWSLKNANPSGKKTAIQQVRVAISQRYLNTQTVSNDDSAASIYQGLFGAQALGVFMAKQGCHLGFETIGSVLPKTYVGNVTLHREKQASFYIDSTLADTQIGDDTSLSPLRDDDPHSDGSDGVVYDLDAPGYNFNPPADGRIHRIRVNFKAFATIQSGNKNGHLPDDTRVSSYYKFFVRLSCTKTATGYMFSNDIPADNQLGKPTTSRAWNLQP